jgi:hypothetical protein
MYKVIICGDRAWSNVDSIRKVVSNLKTIHGNSLFIIEGGAAGADVIAGMICEDLSVHYAVVKALWETRGRGAGPQRNRVMLALEPNEVIGFHENIAASKGTKDMLTIAAKAGVVTWVHDGKRLRARRIAR